MNRPFLLSPSRNQLQSSAVQFSSTMVTSSHLRTITTASRRVASSRLHPYQSNAHDSSRFAHQLHTKRNLDYRQSTTICSTFGIRTMNITTSLKNNNHPPPPSMVSSSSLSSSSRSFHDDSRVTAAAALSSRRPSRYCYSTISSKSSINNDSLSKQQQQRISLSPLAATTNSLKPKSSTTIRTKTTNANDSAMDDEYGNMESSGQIYTHPQPYHLESFGLFGHHVPAGGGHHHYPSPLPRGVLNPAFINYNTYGTLNSKRDNVLVICHALTGNSSLEAWWGELLGPGKAFDTDRYFIVCANILGSCYGSCGPSSARPGMGGGGDDDDDDDGQQPADITNNDDALSLTEKYRQEKHQNKLRHWKEGEFASGLVEPTWADELEKYNREGRSGCCCCCPPSAELDQMFQEEIDPGCGCIYLSAVVCSRLGADRIGNMAVLKSRYVMVEVEDDDDGEDHEEFVNDDEEALRNRNKGSDTKNDEKTKKQTKRMVRKREIQFIVGPFWPMLLGITYPLIFGVSGLTLFVGLPYRAWYIKLGWTILTVLLIRALFNTGFRDPGILTRHKDPPENENDEEDDAPLRRVGFRWGTEGGPWRWSEQAQTYRPRNSCYDPDTAVVVEEFDHT
mmetsp:Transcript_24620/g.49104  ORF Transcript_24620/g.49104 Transcript_24620/m.49104 type:complete len:621 (-) Transcript_24620:399-2261(-)